MKRGGLKSRGGLKKTGFKRKVKLHKPKNKVKEKSKESPYWKQIRKTDQIHSQIIRLQGADENGIVKCFTCDKQAFWKKSGIECGHFHSRANMGTRWSLIYNKPQCHYCNSTLNGNLKVFEENLIKLYGENNVKQSKRQAESVVRMKLPQIKAMQHELNRILKDLKKEKGL